MLKSYWPGLVGILVSVPGEQYVFLTLNLQEVSLLLFPVEAFAEIPDFSSVSLFLFQLQTVFLTLAEKPVI